MTYNPHRPWIRGPNVGSCQMCSMPWPCPESDERTRVVTAEPDRACEHEDFAANVDVNRIARSDDDPTIIGFYADVRVRCARCNEVFRFIGMDAGMRPDKPMCSVDESEARLPIRPASSDPDFGLGIPGFAVHVRERGA